MTGTTEAFSRVRIDALLADAGWNLTDGTSVLFEHVLGDGSRADYVLCDRAGRPMAVVEAKRASVDPIAAQDQGRHYAEQIEVPFVFLSNGDEVRFLYRRRGRLRTGDHDLLLAGEPRAPDCGALGPACSRRRPHRPEDCGPRVPDRLRRDPVGRGDAWPAEAPPRDGDGHRQDRTTAAFIKLLFESGAVTRVLFLVDRIALASRPWTPSRITSVTICARIDTIAK